LYGCIFKTVKLKSTQDSKICEHTMNFLDLQKNEHQLIENLLKYKYVPILPISLQESNSLQYTLCTRFKSWSYGIWSIRCNKTWPHIHNIIPYLFKRTLIFTFPIIKQKFPCSFHRATRSVVFLKITQNKLIIPNLKSYRKELIFI
jgi:hypothetical protein